MSTATAYQVSAARVTRRIVRRLAAGTWSALETYGALISASYGVILPDDAPDAS